MEILENLIDVEPREIPEKLSLRVQMFWVSLPFNWAPSAKLWPFFWFLFLGIGTMYFVSRFQHRIQFVLKWVLLILVIVALGILTKKFYLVLTTIGTL